MYLFICLSFKLEKKYSFQMKKEKEKDGKLFINEKEKRNIT